MIVELIGVPGCGKTTYAKKYVQEHNAINALDNYLYDTFRVKQNLNKVFLMGYTLCRQPGYSLKVFKRFRKIRFPSKGKYLKMILYVYSVIGALLKAKLREKDCDIIIDEGVNQVIWGVLYNSIDSEVNVMNLQKLFLPYFADEIIWLDVDKTTINNRLKERTVKGGAELKQDIQKDESRLDLAYEYVEMIKSGIDQIGMSDRFVRV
jgi:dephospho-CoA kinase